MVGVDRFGENRPQEGGLTGDRCPVTCNPKGLLMKTFVIWMLLAASLMGASSAQAQETYPLQTTIQKEKGAFLGYVGSSSVTGLNEISNLELGVKWVGLLGQPVEDYTFRWENSGYYFLPGGATKLNRYDLESYPDLLARYDNIRPSSLVLRMSVSADPVDGSTPTPHHFSGGGAGFALGTKYVRSTPHMVVLRAGCRSSNLIASSPPKNRDFIDWDRSLSSGDPDKSAQNTLAGAKQITLSSLRVESVEWPMTRIQSIYDELQDRTNAPEDAEAAAAKAELDSFWGNDRPGVSGKRMTASAGLDRCPDEGVLKAEETYTIEYKEKEGVSRNSYTYDGDAIMMRENRLVDSNGTVIIPWTVDVITGSTKKPFPGLAWKSPDYESCVGSSRYAHMMLYAFNEIDVSSERKSEIWTGGDYTRLSFVAFSDNFDEADRYWLDDTACIRTSDDRLYRRVSSMKRNGARPLTDEQLKYVKSVLVSAGG